MTTVRTFNWSPQTQHGGQVGLSYHGPIHFGLSTSSHPFRTDRIWKQVHAGLGYDMPLHELAPGEVNVRVRAGPRDGLDLEIETPFHRTDRAHLRGVEWMLKHRGVGYEQTGSEMPTSAIGDGDIIGQWYLRTNLWSPEATTINLTQKNNLYAADDELHGPVTEPFAADDFSPRWFWSDHPTDRFHAGAIPVDIGRDFGGSYGDLYLGRADVSHPLDWIANTEQLLSSTDVHLSKATKPMWDSGSIVSAQGIGIRDPTQGSRVEPQPGVFFSGSSSGQAVPSANPWSSNGGSFNSGHGLGHGQRILRTNEGTLHQFVLGRSAVRDTEDGATPVWIHHKKSPFGDMFWNSREQKVNTMTGSAPTWDGKDEVGPDVSASIGVANLRVHGAAFASDSEGTIHAIIEVNDSAGSGHSLWYHKCKRTLIAYNPDPVYDWRWDLASPAVRILGSNTGTERTFGEDFREPSLVCDLNDTLHLAYVATQDGTMTHAQIIFVQKRTVEDWPAFDATAIASGLRHRTVSYHAGGSNTTSAPFDLTGVDKPKVVLRSDSVPIVFFRGINHTTADANRRHSALYANAGSTTGDGGSASLYSFDPSQAHPVGGYGNGGSDQTFSTNPNDGVMFYDALIDEHNIAWAVYIMPGDTSGSVNGSGEPMPYLTRITTFDSMKSLSSQYDLTEGLGLSTTLFHSPPTTPFDGGLSPHLHSPTIGTDGKGNIHIVACSRYQAVYSGALGQIGSDRMVDLPLLREDGVVKEHAPYPLRMPGVKAGLDVTPSKPNPSDGGGYGPATSTLETEVLGWPGSHGAFNPQPMEHLLEMWFPAHEYSTPSSGAWVIRSMNFRWLSVPSLAWNATTQQYVPVGQADTISGNEDFVHTAPQLRQQRFHGFDASYLDLTWITNERSWISTPHDQSRYFWPFGHPPGYAAEPGTDGWESGVHRLGIPGHAVVD